MRIAVKMSSFAGPTDFPANGWEHATDKLDGGERKPTAEGKLGKESSPPPRIFVSADSKRLS